MNDEVLQEVAGAETVILVSRYEERLARDWILAIYNQGPTNVYERLMAADNANPPTGVQLAQAPTGSWMSVVTIMILARVQDTPVRQMRYEYDEASGPVQSPRRLSTFGGRLEDAPPDTT